MFYPRVVFRLLVDCFFVTPISKHGDMPPEHQHVFSLIKRLLTACVTDFAELSSDLRAFLGMFRSAGEAYEDTVEQLLETGMEPAEQKVNRIYVMSSYAKANHEMRYEV